MTALQCNDRETRRMSHIKQIVVHPGAKKTYQSHTNWYQGRFSQPRMRILRGLNF